MPVVRHKLFTTIIRIFCLQQLLSNSNFPALYLCDYYKVDFSVMLKYQVLIGTKLVKIQVNHPNTQNYRKKINNTLSPPLVLNISASDQQNINIWNAVIMILTNFMLLPTREFMHFRTARTGQTNLGVSRKFMMSELTPRKHLIAHFNLGLTNKLTN